jgi:hypothetical protein
MTLGSLPDPVCEPVYVELEEDPLPLELDDDPLLVGLIPKLAIH